MDSVQSQTRKTVSICCRDFCFLEGKNLFISRLREAYTYGKSVFVSESLHVTEQVKIMQH